MPEIAFIMGKSSTGKDHIFKALKDDPELNLKTVVPYTTRPMRAGETEGVEYHFVDDMHADTMLAEGRVIEMRSYNTTQGLWRYFTADDGQIVIGKGRYLIIGTLEAYIKFCAYYGEVHLLPIYIEVDDGIRLERAMKREAKQNTPDYVEMCRRFLADSEDFAEANLINCGITARYSNNGAIEECIGQIREAILQNLI